MANFLNNEPKFKVGDKVVYSRRHDSMASWEIESIGKGTLTINKVDKFYKNEELVDVDYFVEGLNYVYAEGWLSYAPHGPKFKIGDKVKFTPWGWGCSTRHYQIVDILTVCYQKDGHKEYLYRITDCGVSIPEKELTLDDTSDEEQLVHDLEICGGSHDCVGCSHHNPDGSGTECDQLELDAAELIKKLQKRVKELEEEIQNGR